MTDATPFTRSLRIDVDLIDGVWVACAPWMAASVEGDSFEDVYWKAVAMMPKERR